MLSSLHRRSFVLGGLNPLPTPYFHFLFSPSHFIQETYRKCPNIPPNSL